MINEDKKDYQYVIDEVETAFLKGGENEWDKLLVELIPDNYFHLPCFERGHWLTRARHMKDPSVRIPYCGEEIGMPKIYSGDKENRWGNMLYLTTDMSYRTAFHEANIIKNQENGTLGYFFISDSLTLLDATYARAVGKAASKYGTVDTDKALYALVVLIDKWFNNSDNESDERVYKITNHVAELIRNHTNFDGIVYKTTKNEKNPGWNVALINENKVEWGYSDLLVRDKIGRYKKVASCKSDDYAAMKNFTKERLDLEDFLDYNYPKQVRSICRHQFPEV